MNVDVERGGSIDASSDRPWSGAAVELRSMSMHFGETRVLTDVDLTIAPGEIHAVLGANGSGKSTLIKILSGYHAPSAGSLLLHGKSLTLPASKKELHDTGVRFVHQDLGLFDNLSVADNLALAVGYEKRGGTIRWSDQYRAAKRDLEAVDLSDVDPWALVSTLGPVEKTLVAIARSLRDLPPGRGVLVLDEPTARLPHGDVESLLTRCRALRTQGVALIYVSHRLDEVFAMADRVTVLRDGSVVLSCALAETSQEEVTSVIVGQAAADAAAPGGALPVRRQRGDSPPVLRLRGISAARVRDVDLDVHPGEIVAISGLIGSGRSELGRIVFGAQRHHTGTVELCGAQFHPTPRSSMGAGIGYVPQDRAQGGFSTFDLAENLMIVNPRGYLRRGMLSPSRSATAALETIEQLQVRPPVPRRLLRELSGGNQQKIVLGKWLRLPLKLLVLDEPTYGVDVGARESIMNTILSHARSGLAVLWLDSDIDLVSKHADRVAVMRQGRIVQQLTGNDITAERIAAASYAVGQHAAAAAHR